MRIFLMFWKKNLNKVDFNSHKAKSKKYFLLKRKFMIERHWKGLAKMDKQNEYIDHLKNETFVKLQDINGFISAKIMTRKLENGIEFLIVTIWQNMSAITQFSGKEYDKAVVPEKVEKMMIRHDDHVDHYEIKYKN